MDMSWQRGEISFRMVNNNPALQNLERRLKELIKSRQNAEPIVVDLSPADDPSQRRYEFDFGFGQTPVAMLRKIFGDNEFGATIREISGEDLSRPFCPTEPCTLNIYFAALVPEVSISFEASPPPV